MNTENERQNPVSLASESIIGAGATKTTPFVPHLSIMFMSARVIVENLRKS